MVHCEGEVSEVEEESHSEEELLRRYLLHNCDLSLQVSGLSTGYSKDVHGEVCVCRLCICVCVCVCVCVYN